MWELGLKFIPAILNHIKALNYHYKHAVDS